MAFRLTQRFSTRPNTPLSIGISSDLSSTSQDTVVSLLKAAQVSEPSITQELPSHRAGYDDVDVAWLAENGCYLANTPKAPCEPTADMAVILILASLRGLSAGEASCRSGKWREGFELTDDPYGKTLGIIGMGVCRPSCDRHRLTLRRNREECSEEDGTMGHEDSVPQPSATTRRR